MSRSVECPDCGQEMKIDDSGFCECTSCGLVGYVNELFDGDEEGLDVYDAALLWQGSGEDEDYMYGYSEEELQEAL